MKLLELPKSMFVSRVVLQMKKKKSIWKSPTLRHWLCLSTVHIVYRPSIRGVDYAHQSVLASNHAQPMFTALCGGVRQHHFQTAHFTAQRSIQIGRLTDSTIESELHAMQRTTSADLKLEFNRPNKVTQMSTRYGMIVETDWSILRRAGLKRETERFANLTTTVIERYSVANSLIDTLQLHDFTTLTTPYLGLLMTQLGGELLSIDDRSFDLVNSGERRVVMS